MQRQNIRRGQRQGLHERGSQATSEMPPLHWISHGLDPPPKGLLMVGMCCAGPLPRLLTSMLTSVQAKIRNGAEPNRLAKIGWQDGQRDLPAH